MELKSLDHLKPAGQKRTIFTWKKSKKIKSKMQLKDHENY